MTERKTDPANSNAMGKYLDDLQSMSTRLAGVLTAAAFLENEGRCEEGRSTLVYLAEELANDLTGALDVVRRPKGELA